MYRTSFLVSFHEACRKNFIWLSIARFRGTPTSKKNHFEHILFKPFVPFVAVVVCNSAGINIHGDWIEVDWIGFSVGRNAFLQLYSSYKFYATLSSSVQIESSRQELDLDHLPVFRILRVVVFELFRPVCRRRRHFSLSRQDLGSR